MAEKFFSVFVFLLVSLFRAFAEELLDAGALVCLSDVNQQVSIAGSQ